MTVSQAATGRGQGRPPNVRGRGHRGRIIRTLVRRIANESPHDKRILSETPM